MKPYRVGLVGMGQIAAGYDNPSDRAVRTHLKAVLQEPRLCLAAVADIDEIKARAELARFGSTADILSPEQILQADLDVLCIATPDGTHLDLVELAAAGSAKLVLCEKPLECDGQRRRQACRAMEKNGGTLVMNHSRQWLPDIGNAFARASGGDYGAPISAVVHYCRGFRHNGIHALDLLAGFLGGQVLSASRIADDIFDYSAQDATRSLLVTLDFGGHAVPVLIRGIDGRIQNTFEFDIRFERARVRVFDDKWTRMEIYGKAVSEYFGFADELTLTHQFVDEPASLMQRAWCNVADYLQGEAPMASSGSNALLAYDLADAILDQAGRSQR